MIITVCICLAAVVLIGSLTVSQNTEAMVFGNSRERMTFMNRDGNLVLVLKNGAVSTKTSEVLRLFMRLRVLLPASLNGVIWLLTS